MATTKDDPAEAPKPTPDPSKPPASPPTPPPTDPNKPTAPPTDPKPRAVTGDHGRSQDAPRGSESHVGEPPEQALKAATEAVEQGKHEHSEEVARQMVTGHAAPIDSGMAGPREEQERKVRERSGGVYVNADPNGPLGVRDWGKTLDHPVADAVLPDPQQQGVQINGTTYLFTPGEAGPLPEDVKGVVVNTLTPVRTDQMKNIPAGGPVVNLDDK